MSQSSKKDGARQRRHDEGNKGQRKQAPNGSAKGEGGSLLTDSNSKMPQSNNSKNQLNKKDKQQKDKERNERVKFVLWRRPLQTLMYCALELIELLRTWSIRLLKQRLLMVAILVLGILISFLYKQDGPHQAYIELVHKNTWFFVYWIGLGVLSSVGLGTGLHTFLLYLGPHIASVTLAAYECNSLDFPSPPYPDEIVCPAEPYAKQVPNIWSIMTKVRLEAFLWGLGTALGELPPYFMAKAARLSGYDSDDSEELAEFEALNAKRNKKNLSLIDKAKLRMERIVERVGFFGILACASIPNPLFDLAGITCGHFMVPFWTFFGATFIGKAIVKMHIQKMFVIIGFNEPLIESAVDKLRLLPYLGPKLQQPFKTLLQDQKTRLHRKKGSNIPRTGSGNLLSTIFDTFVMLMICYFVVSLVNSLAQSYHKRLCKKNRAAATSWAAQEKSPNEPVRKQGKSRAMRD